MQATPSPCHRSAMQIAWFSHAQTQDRPLCLEDVGRADLALSVDQVSEVYRAATILTLDMAYNNARLIARLDREWLEPIAPTNVDGDDDDSSSEVPD